jgi:fused signal recognition particle receptor
MFGKLKEKLKGWFKSSKETVEETAPKKEVKVEEPAKKPEKKKVEEKKKPEKKKPEPKPAKPKEKKKAKPEKKETKGKLKPQETIGVLGKEKEEVKKEIHEKVEEIPQETPKTVKEAQEEIKKTQEKVEEIEEKEEELEEAIQRETKGKLKPEEEPKKEQETPAEEPAEEEEKEPVKEKKGFFRRLVSSFSYQITEEEFDRIFDDLEMLLLENNVALEVVEDLKENLSKKLVGKEISKDKLEQEIQTGLKNSLNEILIEPENPLKIIKSSDKPFVILFFGINGTGKTTSIAKFANLLQKNNLTVALAAADTFRAASIEQISEHADRLKVPLIKHDYGSDPAAVGFDAIKYAKANNLDVVLIDTAGRMHTKTNLLAEMEKICRVTNPNLKVFVAESIAGNDATEQAKAFNEAVSIDGSILSKADIDEKGGTIISIGHTTKKPIFYLGTGQNYDDLELFNKKKFIESLGLE